MQVPLVRNPQYHPPKAVTLNLNYNKMLPTLAKSVVPPKVTLTREDLTNWRQQTEQHRATFDVAKNDEAVARFEEWLIQKRRQVAPGFDADGGVMTPKKERVGEPRHEEINELDKVFGRTSIRADKESG